MKKVYSILSIMLASLLFLSACGDSKNSSVSVADEFSDYEEGIAPLYDRSLKLIEMSGHFTTIVEQPEQAYNYLRDEILPYVEESKKIAEDLQGSLENRELKDLNEISLKQFDLMLESFSKQAEVMKLNIPPMSDEEFNQSQDIYMEVVELEEQIDQVIEEYNAKYDELEEKYGE
ncbi:hypothetical protein [Salirhabdus sp. Marseille-P4669]|uniref:hypothetical protein n=1 Tax=Salirhabdus sp. Marseille-P4669 TaxID=2042310 RepID=UPI000C7C8C6B|nr:hypothetical protein [Salirhabdus sp. Marseille-P4669]